MVQLCESRKSRANIIKKYDLSASAFDCRVEQSQKTGFLKKKIIEQRKERALSFAQSKPAFEGKE
jgi:transposase